MGVSKKEGTRFWSPYSKEHNVLGLYSCKLPYGIYIMSSFKGLLGLIKGF